MNITTHLFCFFDHIYFQYVKNPKPHITNRETLFENFKLFLITIFTQISKKQITH
ncbi:hypothetical protein FlaCF_2868 [Flavobacterium tructae]